MSRRCFTGLKTCRKLSNVKSPGSDSTHGWIILWFGMRKSSHFWWSQIPVPLGDTNKYQISILGRFCSPCRSCSSRYETCPSNFSAAFLVDRLQHNAIHFQHRTLFQNVNVKDQFLPFQDCMCSFSAPQTRNTSMFLHHFSSHVKTLYAFWQWLPLLSAAATQASHGDWTTIHWNGPNWWLVGDCLGPVA